MCKHGVAAALLRINDKEALVKEIQRIAKKKNQPI